MNLADVVADIYPVIPMEPPSHNDFLREIGQEILKTNDIREVAFSLWEQHMAADSIMKVLSISERELDAIIPRSRWFDAEWKSCPRCGGKGGWTLTVPWKRK